MNAPVCPEHGPMRPTARFCPVFYCRACRERALARERAETPQIADAYVLGDAYDFYGQDAFKYFVDKLVKITSE